MGEVREITWEWMQEYNNERGHDALGNLTPIEFYQRAEVSTFGLST
jgi:putative transposase